MERYRVLASTPWWAALMWSVHTLKKNVFIWKMQQGFWRIVGGSGCGIYAIFCERRVVRDARHGMKLTEMKMASRLEGGSRWHIGSMMFGGDLSLNSGNCVGPSWHEVMIICYDCTIWKNQMTCYVILYNVELMLVIMNLTCCDLVWRKRTVRIKLC
jgi:hypothetical protein